MTPYPGHLAITQMRLRNKFPEAELFVTNVCICSFDSYCQNASAKGPGFLWASEKSCVGVVRARKSGLGLGVPSQARGRAALDVPCVRTRVFFSVD